MYIHADLCIFVHGSSQAENGERYKYWNNSRPNHIIPRLSRIQQNE